MAGALVLVTFGMRAQQAHAASPAWASITNAVQAYVQQDAADRHFKLISMVISAAEVQQSGTTVTLTYGVTTTHTLDVASPDDWPAVKGIENFLTNNPRLSATAEASVQQLLDAWKTRIQGYIENPFTTNETIEATANMDSSGNVIAGTIRVFLVNPDGSLEPAAQALAAIPLSNTVEEGFSVLASNMAASPDTLCQPNGQCPLNNYNATNAISYADAHVWHDCGTGSGRMADCTTNSTYGCIEWPSYYNLSYWYSGEDGTAPCNDCANFVSQTLNAGGIATTSAWYEYPSSTNPQPGSSAWTDATDLEQYMTTNDPSSVGTPYWSQISSQSDVVPGDVLYHYTGSGTGHVMFAAYGDGLSAEWDEHTNDGYHLYVGSTYEATYYSVSDWIWGP